MFITSDTDKIVVFLLTVLLMAPRSKPKTPRRGPYVRYDQKQVEKALAEVVRNKKEVSCLREKSKSVYVFPQIEDINTISKTQIISKLPAPKIIRGKYIFKTEEV